MSSKTLLILGAGGNTGTALAKTFKANGWQVATVARSPAKDPLTQHTSLHVQADFTNPSSVTEAYEKVEKELGIPNAVIYNAYAATFMQPEKSGFDVLSVEKFNDDLIINTTSVYAALKAAVAGFERLPADASKTFIYTGNMLTGIVSPESLTLGVGKNATLYLLELALSLYGDLAHFYSGDERDVNGDSVMDKISGEAHAAAYWELANDPKQQPVNYTFVKGKGYAKFDVDRASRPVEHVGDLLKKAAAAAGGS